MSFSINLRTLLSEKSLTQKVIAENFNTTQQTVSRWLNGQNEPDITTLIKLADFFEVSVDYLLGRENDYAIIKSSSAPTLTKTQTELLSVFNLLSEEDQHQVIGFAKALAY